MTSADLSSSPTAATVLPDPWRSEIVAALGAGESVIACLELDLNLRLRFDQGIVVLTDRHLLAKAPGDPEWQRWEFRPAWSWNTAITPASAPWTCGMKTACWPAGATRSAATPRCGG